MRVLSWTLLLAGISVFTMGCEPAATTPVETDTPVVTEGDDAAHEHADGEVHVDEAAPAENEAAPVEPAPEAEAPAAPEGDAAAPAEPQLDLDVQN